MDIFDNIDNAVKLKAPKSSKSSKSKSNSASKSKSSKSKSSKNKERKNENLENLDQNSFQVENQTLNSEEIQDPSPITQTPVEVTPESIETRLGALTTNDQENSSQTELNNSENTSINNKNSTNLQNNNDELNIDSNSQEPLEQDNKELNLNPNNQLEQPNTLAEENWYDEDDDENTDYVSSTQKVIGMRVRKTKTVKNAETGKTTIVEVDENEEKKQKGWGNASKDSSIEKKTENTNTDQKLENGNLGGLKKTEATGTENKAGRKFVAPGARARQFDTSGISSVLSNYSGLSSRAGMGYGPRGRKPVYKVDDKNSFPTLGAAMDNKPEGFTNVVNNRSNENRVNSRRGLDTSNRFGGLEH